MPLLFPLRARLLAGVVLWSLLVLSFGLLGPLVVPLQARAEVALDDQTKVLIIDAVEAAFELDLYNNRCRQDRSGRRTENLNKILASGFRMTVLDAQDDLFPEGYYRDAQARMSEDFLRRLREMGGCSGAKEAKLRDELRDRYVRVIDELEAFP